MKELGVAKLMMLPPGFARVTACLQRDQLQEEVSNPDSLRMAIISGPAIVTMSAKCIVKDEATRVTYMDTVTTLVGWVTLSGPKQEAPTQGTTMQDVTDLI